MAGASTKAHTVRWLLPDLLERGRTVTLSAPLYLDAALVEPASATVAVYDSAGNEILAATAATIASSVASYDYAVPSTLTLGDGWRVQWELTLSGGEVLAPRNDAAVVRTALRPVIDDADLFRRQGGLDPSASERMIVVDDFQRFRDESWVKIQGRLIAAGRRPWLVLSPSALREAHINLTLAMIFDEIASRTVEAGYRDTADRYRDEYRDAWSDLTLDYDEDDDGNLDARVSGTSSFWMSGR